MSQSSLYNRNGYYKWLQDAISSSSLPAVVKYKQNSAGNVAAEEIVKILAVTLPNLYSNPDGNVVHPVQAYSSKSALMMRYKTYLTSFTTLSLIAVDILDIFDLVSTELATEIKRTKGFDIRKVTGVKYNSPLFNTTVLVGAERVPSSIILPVMSGLRAWVKLNSQGHYNFYRSKAFILSDIRKLYPDIIKITDNYWNIHGGNPNDLGKDHNYWQKLYELFHSYSLKIKRPPLAAPGGVPLDAYVEKYEEMLNRFNSDIEEMSKKTLNKDGLALLDNIAKTFKFWRTC